VAGEFDFVLLMTVEPGFAGQKFIPAMYEKIRSLREILDRIRPGIAIEVDGNLDLDSSSRSVRCGATTLVGGTSSVFRPGQDVYAAYTKFDRELKHALARTERHLESTQSAETSN
jgi:ribulose-phosphate 3-epimerase